MFPEDQWALRVGHYTPWLSYWRNTQNWFPGFAVIANNPDLLSHQDKEITAKFDRKSSIKVIFYLPLQLDFQKKKKGN